MLLRALSSGKWFRYPIRKRAPFGVVAAVMHGDGAASVARAAKKNARKSAQVTRPARWLTEIEQQWWPRSPGGGGGRTHVGGSRPPVSRARHEPGRLNEKRLAASRGAARVVAVWSGQLACGKGPKLSVGEKDSREMTSDRRQRGNYITLASS
jgi:hypothetical protein